jgi:hypothetical protein
VRGLVGDGQSYRDYLSVFDEEASQLMLLLSIDGGLFRLSEFGQRNSGGRYRQKAFHHRRWIIPENLLFHKNT